ncbi:MAG TPA: hypothetical protein VJP76_01040, partial [Candidatus Tumulicola sp.]|nr:hypothetical protein [Candidatus Tumulicola sp.]
MRGVAPFRARDERRQIVFDLSRRGAQRRADPVRDAEDVGIDRQSSLCECVGHHHAGGLAPDPGQRFEI